ncbi:genetic competence negative regulator [Halobacillus litoralis]|uniref:Genetic competence negative regulator n=1 Tax=Halobacillus litoralis TaxID=45668 RepID=A0A845DQH1_9BACI|nr:MULTISPECIES: genetic competence negative regulator [Halobacillus]MCA1022697.1 genetic competence negative regulator [Halobacillus litoralis]MYL19448.1 genetic competence negative regulator [Halobacillus litoralis]MYL28594.1 genetic competence negative regulator [Halobacillus halophilus]MYL37975.1 genetic competence negative regulator [Halobacillus litoralis]
MRVERMTNEKFKIFLTFDDLMDRGLSREELWNDLPRVHRIFSDMMYDAGIELGVELTGVLLVQVYLLQAQGMLVVVTKTEPADIEEDDEDYLEMKVTLDESKEMMFSFSDFEHVIQAGTHLHQLGVTGGSIYHYEDSYYMLLEDTEIDHMDQDQVIALLSEYASATAVTSHRLIEYGNTIMDKDACQSLTKHFS